MIVGCVVNFHTCTQCISIIFTDVLLSLVPSTPGNLSSSHSHLFFMFVFPRSLEGNLQEHGWGFVYRTVGNSPATTPQKKISVSLSLPPIYPLACIIILQEWVDPMNAVLFHEGILLPGPCNGIWFSPGVEWGRHNKQTKELCLPCLRSWLWSLQRFKYEMSPVGSHVWILDSWWLRCLGEVVGVRGYSAWLVDVSL